jgi:hypothetical protein
LYDWQVDLDPNDAQDKIKLRERKGLQKRGTLKSAGIIMLYKKVGIKGLEEVRPLAKEVHSKVERSLLFPQPRSSGSGAADDISEGSKCTTGLAAAQEIPNPISKEYAQELKSQVRNMVPGDIKDYYPQLVLSYASGRRPGDAEGTGPGFVQAFHFIERLKENGHMCFSGLHVPAGDNWEIYFLRLDGDKAKKAKVMIALLTTDYFKSSPCMRELYKAIKAKVKILLVRMEEHMPPPKEDQWEGTMEVDAQLERMHVRDFLGKTNAIPHPGTLPTVPDAFREILCFIRRNCDALHSSSEQVPKSVQVKT